MAQTACVPSYLASLINDNQPTHSLRSSDQLLLNCLPMSLTYADKAFYSVPCIWNSLPLAFREAASDSFKCKAALADYSRHRYSVFEFLTPLPHPPGANRPHRERGHIGRHCPYTNKIWYGSVHALLRYRSKTAKMQTFPIDSHSNENFISPFFCRWGPLTPKRGEDTSETRVCPHAKFGWYVCTQHCR